VSNARSRLTPGESRPPIAAGLAIGLLGVAAMTGLISALKPVAPAVSLGVVYLPAILLISVYWGPWLGIATSILSAAAFNWFHIPPTGQITIADSRNWVALAAFTVVAVATSAVSELARNRALEAERRREEADLAADLARDLLVRVGTADALGGGARRVADSLGVASAAIEFGAVEGDSRRRAFSLEGPGGERLATLLVPATISADSVERLESSIAPTLAALIAIALERDRVQSEAVETAALRRSDDLKTALLRAVSHDLRTPLTAIVAAGHALRAKSLTPDEQDELSGAVIEEGERLAALVDKLLDLSLLRSGKAESRRDWVSIEDVLLAARDSVKATTGAVKVAVDRAAPALEADAAQLERVFVNLLENASRYSGGRPVLVRARAVGSRLIIRVVDRGPGIGAVEQERIFEPFYRGPQNGVRSPGSGLGLAIARGFVEANGGTIGVESLPGQGTSFVISFPIEPEPAPAVAG
jgi:two-component system sensor histidine kinase KdpD